MVSEPIDQTIGRPSFNSTYQSQSLYRVTPFTLQRRFCKNELSQTLIELNN